MKGLVKIDNNDINKFDLYSLRNQIGFVPQETLLFSGTIQSNISLPKPEASFEEIREAIGYGVIKMNIDTDMQYAYMSGVRDYFSKNNDYLQSQIGNPDGGDVPNKKYYDPRKWVRSAEESFVERLKKAFEDLNNVNTL